MGKWVRIFFFQVLQSTQFTLISWKIFVCRDEGVMLGVINFGILEPLGGGTGKGKQTNPLKKKKMYLALLLSWKSILLLTKANAAQISSD